MMTEPAIPRPLSFTLTSWWTRVRESARTHWSGPSRTWFPAPALVPSATCAIISSLRTGSTCRSISAASIYLYDVPGGAERGGHAHKAQKQPIIAMSGSFDVVLDDWTQRKRFHLNRSYFGLYVGPMTWRELDNFSSGSVSMVLASTRYEEDDYIRDYDTFLDTIRDGGA